MLIPVIIVYIRKMSSNSNWRRKKLLNINELILEEQMNAQFNDCAIGKWKILSIYNFLQLITTNGNI